MVKGGESRKLKQELTSVLGKIILQCIHTNPPFLHQVLRVLFCPPPPTALVGLEHGFLRSLPQPTIALAQIPCLLRHHERGEY